MSVDITPDPHILYRRYIWGRKYHRHNHNLQYKIFVGPQQLTPEGYLFPEIPIYYQDHKSNHTHTPYNTSKSTKSLSRSSSLPETDEFDVEKPSKKSRKQKPKLLTIIRRTESPPNSYFKILLNKNVGQSYPDLLSNMSEALGHRWQDNPISGLVARDGNPANNISDLFKNGNVFIAVGDRDLVSGPDDIEKIIAETFPNDDPDNAASSNGKVSEDNKNMGSSSLTPVEEEDLDADDRDDELRPNIGTRKGKLNPKSYRKAITYNKSRIPAQPQTMSQSRPQRSESDSTIDLPREYPYNDSRKPGAFYMQPERPTEDVLPSKVRAHIMRYERIRASQKERARARMLMARKIEMENRELESERDLPKGNKGQLKMNSRYPMNGSSNVPYRKRVPRYSDKFSSDSQIPRKNYTNGPSYPYSPNRGGFIPYKNGIYNGNVDYKRKRKSPPRNSDERDNGWKPPNFNGQYPSYPTRHHDDAFKPKNLRPYTPFQDDNEDDDYRSRNLRPNGKKPLYGANRPKNTNGNFRLPTYQSYPNDELYGTKWTNNPRPNKKEPADSYTYPNKQPIDKTRTSRLPLNYRDRGPWEDGQSNGRQPWKEYPPFSLKIPKARMRGNYPSRDFQDDERKLDKSGKPKTKLYNHSGEENDKDKAFIPASSDEDDHSLETKRRPDGKRPVGKLNPGEGNTEQWARIPPISFSSKPHNDADQNRYRAPQNPNLLGTVREEDGDRKAESNGKKTEPLQGEDRRTDTRSLSSLIGPRGDTVKITDTINPLQRPTRSKRQSMIVQNPKSDRIVPQLASQLPIDDNFNDIFDVGRLLATGNFSEVKEAKDRKDGTPCAVKIIDKPKLKDKEDLVEEEIRILMSCDHPNIMELKEQFESPGKVFLVTELAKEGDLFDAICDNIKFTEPQSAVMMRDLGRALFYLHSRGIVHRDIKPENLLVIKTNGIMNLKLADFGLAIEAKELLFVICGTATYVAPEILSEQGYGMEVDIWAAGVVAYILLCGFPPFRSTDRKQTELFEFIKAGEFEYLSPYWDNISSDARDFIDQMIVIDPRKRYTAMDVLSHPWILTLGNSIRFNTPIEEIRSQTRQELMLEAEKFREDYRRIREMER